MAYGRREVDRAFVVVEYTGDLPSAPTADIHTVARSLALIEYTETAQREVDRAFALIEYTEAAQRQINRAFVLIEYSGDLPAAPTADIHTVARSFALIEYTETARREIDRAFVLLEYDAATEYIAAGGTLYRWTGTQWVRAKMRRWTGTQWVLSDLKRWDGVDWLDVDATGT